MSDRSPPALLDRLKTTFADLSEAERTIANFILVQPTAIPFETGESLAKRLGISAITVGRFCRKFGYRNFRDLKAQMKFDTPPGLPWTSAGQFGWLADGGRSKALGDDLRIAITGLTAAYALASGPKWDAIIELLAGSARVHVAGFQTERGIAQHFAALLQYARTGVVVVDASSSSFLEVLAEDEPNRCLVIVETRRYSVHARRLAEDATAAGMAVVIVTDSYCNWAPQVTPHVLAVSTDSALFWTTMVPLVAVLTLLADGVVLRLGPDHVTPRLDRISRIYQDFIGHTGSTPSRGD
ncbi:hypothetical protein ASE75_02960 [Sphingomonas sp. Leaf17]|uniref:MurR/RpiR family transcriptional regulator n=1 Tax=Sphingomonas sp. Leaf17 TaxID=1735683 RepID=UPI0006F4257F|nr:MurR/RpiR family transcriptional regulator [Sphingomonas sp. Leaf17]KQM67861.1 hypothetical protein ASE75_02960 [Sphingomonas sp. Leaf17]